MRISDWSSDVCSSDLRYGPNGPQGYQRPDGSTGGPGRGAIGGPSEVKLVSFSTAETGNATRVAKGNTTYTDSINYLPPNSFARARVIVGVDASAGVNSQTDRSEEHTSELQSLMRMSYAVFCLTKKKTEALYTPMSRTERS